jgi:hypothetical protein
VGGQWGDRSNQRRLAVMKVTSSGAQVIAPTPRSFSSLWGDPSEFRGLIDG